MSRETRIGDSVVVNKKIIDHGEDHHPPTVIAYAGDRVYVRQICGSSLMVYHEGNPNSFILRDGEYRKE